jgi:hypothetical protein
VITFFEALHRKFAGQVASFNDTNNKNALLFKLEVKLMKFIEMEKECK